MDKSEGRREGPFALWKGEWWGGEGKKVGSRDLRLTGSEEEVTIHRGREVSLGETEPAALAVPITESGFPAESHYFVRPHSTETVKRKGRGKEGRGRGPDSTWAYQAPAQDPFCAENPEEEPPRQTGSSPCPDSSCERPDEVRRPLSLSALTFPSKQP